MTELRYYHLNKKEQIIFRICLVASGMALSLLLYRNIWFFVAILPFSHKIRSLTEERIAGMRRKKYLVQFKDFLFMASTAIGAGRSIKDAIKESIPSLVNIYGANALLVNDLKMAYERMEKGGESDVRVLEDMALASGLEDVSDFVTIYAICKTSGANLITALLKAAGVISEKMSIEKEIEELVRRKQSEGIAILVMPVAVITFLNVFAPDYIAPMYETLYGRLIMSMAAAATTGVYLMIRHITKVSI